mgnify:CR=1 FL=1
MSKLPGFFDQENIKWKDAMIKKGHTPILDYDGVLNVWVLDEDYDEEDHNGPGCSSCNWSCCMYCDDIDSIPECSNKKE